VLGCGRIDGHPAHGVTHLGCSLRRIMVMG